MTPSLQLRRSFCPASFLAIVGLSASLAVAEPVTLNIQTDKPGISVAPTLHGLFFEDINYGADGGLYAELVQNRSFEHRDAMYAWTQSLQGGAEGKIAVMSDRALNANNPHFLRLEVTKAGMGGVAAVNSGFDGIRLQAGETYHFSVYARRYTGKQTALRIILEDARGRMLAVQHIEEIGTEWKKYECDLKTAVDEAKACLVVVATTPGEVDVDMASLFPAKTFKNRANGLRADLAQTLADIKPGFLRFPGGCVVEGSAHADMYRWKDTVGDVAERKQNWNLWSNDASPQYHQTYGLGFYEYFQFCEDIGAEPLPVLNCGMCCQARGGTHVPLDQLQPYVQDALDLIEFANGPVSTKWGALRAKMGHPAPFNLKYLGVGNEQWMQEYFDRYDIFYKALKAKHPEIALITTAGPQENDGFFKFAWGKFKSGTPADIVDEHYYRPPQWFFQFNNRYDSYDRKGPKIFVGEYAAHDHNRRNNLRSAIAEASFAMGLWRNADVVAMSSYAPLLANVNHVQWGPDLIWFDNSHVIRTPSYHVQALLGQNRPDTVVPVQVQAPTVVPPALTGRIGFGTTFSQAEFKDVKVVKDGKTLLESDFSKNADGWTPRSGDWSIEDGAFRQSNPMGEHCAYAGDPSWSNYTLTLKARKIGGNDGFMINFAGQGGRESTWRVGVIGGVQDRLEIPGATDPYVPGNVVVGQWHEYRIEVKGSSVKCYQDGQFIQEADCQPYSSVFASAGRIAATGEIVVGITNTTEKAQTVRINLAGIAAKNLTGTATLLTGAEPEHDNTFEEPNRVQPSVEAVAVKGPQFDRTLPPWSFTILRLKP
ncbi:MAG: alpha-L-arabinofuranosidase C-terminal domain-containing protein [Nibricoccus sp.]